MKNDLDPFLAENLANWNARVPVHLAPGGYRIERYMSRPRERTKRTSASCSGSLYVLPEGLAGKISVCWTVIATKG